MFCYRDYQLTTRFNQQNEKSTSNGKSSFNPGRNFAIQHNAAAIWPKEHTAPYQRCISLWKSSSHTTPETTFNHHCNTQFRNQTYQTTWNNGHTHHLTPFRATSASHDHQSFHKMRSFQSKSSFNNDFPGEDHNNYSHNPNISLCGQGISYLEKVTYAVNNLNLIMKVMVDQAIIKAAMSSIENVDSSKNKFEAWITLVKNTAQISDHDI